jgi:hypothetical protein
MSRIYRTLIVRKWPNMILDTQSSIDGMWDVKGYSYGVVFRNIPLLLRA